MIQEYGNMDGCKQNKVYRLPHHFLPSPGYTQLALLTDFLIHPLHMGAFSQAMLYVDWIEKREFWH